ncbi:glycoside hydrolase family 3 C-terminal domain-containing protein [Mangrovimonas sp. AS39]|uniref:glycoside hydrolase family 3 C-terminal domain-containing protein n=1 Tax=Mangrovimonas futianensis TaxID=2895523 RepID=UPI001E565E0A|nr:glycoside hydrolase family 3 C-terminal domain-containing protein [Mangrovimonas futianensis]MCF1192193.1 glycoside hydrolase family 3 C-terminal domain-containing protein [Mangrovimonas futianensis]MCF1196058.1 glycoside hydrolase family 3 C-terminal domain-containing protein [Mangrovimonas futianensis]
MNNKLIYSSVLAVAMVFTSCKNEQKTEETASVQVEKSKTYQGTPISKEFDSKIDSLVSAMTLEEKAGMLHGSTMFATAAVERLGIPELTMADGPLGVREEISLDSWAPAGWDNDFATYYPAAGGVAATWNTDLAYVFGNSVGEETIARDKDVLLSPAINIIRTPLGGRTYEYFTEDPFLNKKLTVPFIVGLQENDVAACVKHFAANNQETHRDFVDVQIDERTLREIYLPAFKAAVEEAHAYSFMGAYNKFRGDYLCENDYMLNQVLRDEWGFEGIVISDWAAVHDTKKALESGTDIEMGTPKPFNEFYFADALIQAVKDGKIDEKQVDKSVKRILRMMYTLKSVDDKGRAKGSISTEAHFQDAYAIAAESVVLLKNENNLLPLKTEGVKSIAVIGNNAKKKNALGGFGAGVKTKREVTPLEGLQNRLPEDITINYAEGYLERYSNNEKAKLGDITLNGPVTINELDPKMLEEALEAAKNSDMAIVFAGSNRDYETEASDRATLALPFGQEELIEKVLAVNPNTIVVFIAGAPFDIKKVADQSKAVIWSWFNGSEGGNALADVILGTVNPSGKLPWTMPVKLEDSPAHATNSFPGDQTVSYDEGILVGYRWFDTKNVEPLYPFGYGLSYTNFSLSNLKTDKSDYGLNDTITVEVSVENTGEVSGKEVVQVYVSKPESKVERAAQELKGFSKVEVAAGSTKTTTVEIPVKELAFYNVDTKSWEVEKGAYSIQVGNSSRNILSKVQITIK